MRNEAKNQLRNHLMERLEDNLLDFHTYLNSLSRTDLIVKAGRIAAVYEAYFFMTNRHAWEDASELALLLLLQNPLTAVADAWEAARADNLCDMEYAIAEVYDSEDTLSEYPLATESCVALTDLFDAVL